MNRPGVGVGGRRDGGGIGLPCRLRQDPEFAATPLVAVTGYGQEVDRSRSRTAGIDYHLTKPVDPTTLQQLLAKPQARTH